MVNDNQGAPLAGASLYKDVLGKRESSGDYAAVNQLGYIGKYQFGGMALIDTGYKDSQGNWTGKDGINSTKDFLNAPQVQERAQDSLMGLQERYLANNGAMNYVGQEFNGETVTREGLMMASHLVGAGAVNKMLRTGEVPQDANGTKAVEYLSMGNGIANQQQVDAQQEYETAPQEIQPIKATPTKSEQKQADMKSKQTEKRAQTQVATEKKQLKLAGVSDEQAKALEMSFEDYVMQDPDNAGRRATFYLDAQRTAQDAASNLQQQQPENDPLFDAEEDFALNTALSTVNTTFKILGGLVSAPTTVLGTAAMAGITEDDLKTWKTVKEKQLKGQELTEDEQSFMQAQGADKDDDRIVAQLSRLTGDDSIAQVSKFDQIETAVGTLDISDTIQDTAGFLTPYVDTQLTDGLVEGVKDSYDRFDAGEIDFVDFLGETVDEVASNPGAVGQATVESLPYMISSALNLPLTVASSWSNNLREAVKTYTANNDGVAPTGEKLSKIVALSGAQSAVDHFGDRIITGKFEELAGVFKGTVASSATKAGIKVGTGSAGEFAAEGGADALGQLAETAGEGEVDVGQSVGAGTLGAASGGTTAGAIESAKLSNQVAQEAKERTAAKKQADESDKVIGKASVNVTSEKFDVKDHVEKVAKQIEDVDTPEEKQALAKRLRQDIDSYIEHVQKSFDGEPTPEQEKATREIITKITEAQKRRAEIEAGLPQVAEQTQTTEPQATTQAPQDTPEKTEQVNKVLASMELNDDSASVDEVEAVLRDDSIKLTDVQKAAAKAYLKTRRAASNMDDTAREIKHGSKNNIGVEQYLKIAKAALNADNEADATEALTRLRRFRNKHAEPLRTGVDSKGKKVGSVLKETKLKEADYMDAAVNELEDLMGLERTAVNRVKDGRRTRPDTYKKSGKKPIFKELKKSRPESKATETLSTPEVNTGQEARNKLLEGVTQNYRNAVAALQDRNFEEEAKTANPELTDIQAAIEGVKLQREAYNAIFDDQAEIDRINELSDEDAIAEAGPSESASQASPEAQANADEQTEQTETPRPTLEDYLEAPVTTPVTSKSPELVRRTIPYPTSEEQTVDQRVTQLYNWVEESLFDGVTFDLALEAIELEHGTPMKDRVATEIAKNNQLGIGRTLKDNLTYPTADDLDKQAENPATPVSVESAPNFEERLKGILKVDSISVPDKYMTYVYNDIVEALNAGAKLKTSLLEIVPEYTGKALGKMPKDVRQLQRDINRLQPKEGAVNQKEMTKDYLKSINWVKEFFAPMGKVDNIIQRIPTFWRTDFRSNALVHLNRDSFTADETEHLTDISKWVNALTNSFHKVYDKDYYDNPNNPKWQNLMSYLTDSNGNIDEGVVQALATSAYNWVMESGNDTLTMEESTMNSLLGESQDKPLLDKKIKNQLRYAGQTYTEVTKSLGSDVRKTLGIKAKRTASGNLDSRLERSLGIMALNMLRDAQVITYKSPEETGIDMAHLKKRYTGSNINETTRFIRIKDLGGKKRYKANARIQKSMDLARDSRKSTPDGEQHMMEGLFGFEKVSIFPTFDKPTSVATKIAGVAKLVPEKLLPNILKQNQREYYTKNDHLKVFDDLGEHAERALGKLDPEKFHVSQRETIETLNESLSRSWNYMNEFRDMQDQQEGGREAPFYMELSPWKNGRYGIKQNRVNGQTNKLQRAFLAMKGWREDLDPNDGRLMKQFWASMDEHIGIDKEQDFNEKEKMAPARRGVEILMYYIDNGQFENDAVKAELAEILHQTAPKGGKAGNLQGGAQSNALKMDDLMHIARYYIAKRDKTTFRSEKFLEVDGKTNGMAITLLQYGVLPEKMFNMFGYFREGDEHTNYADYKDAGGKDVYNTLGDNWRELFNLATKGVKPTKQQAKYLGQFLGSKAIPMTDEFIGMVQLAGQETLTKEQMKQFDALESGQVMPKSVQKLVRKMMNGPMYTPEQVAAISQVFGLGNVESPDDKAWRNIAKSPLMVIFYGSGESAVAETIQATFVSNIYDLINEYALEENVGAYNDLMKALSALTNEPIVKEANSVEDMLTQEITPQLEQKLYDAAQSFGELSGEGVREMFPEYLEMRDRLTDGADLMFRMQYLVREHMIEKAREQALAEGLIVDKVTDLPASVIKEIDDQLAKMAPHTFSNKSRNAGSASDNDRINYAVDLSKTRSETDTGQSIRVPLKNAPKGSNQSVGTKTVPATPGVAGIGVSVHNLDSEDQIEMMFREFDVAGVHDAFLFGISQAEEGGRAYNEVHSNTMKNNSIVLEMNNAVQTASQELGKYLRSIPGNEGRDLLRKINQESLVNSDPYSSRIEFNPDAVGSPTEVLQNLAEVTRRAEEGRKAILGRIKYVNQYADINGFSSYEVKSGFGKKFDHIRSAVNPIAKASVEAVKNVQRTVSSVNSFEDLSKLGTTENAPLRKRRQTLDEARAVVGQETTNETPTEPNKKEVKKQSVRDQLRSRRRVKTPGTPDNATPPTTTNNGKTRIALAKHVLGTLLTNDPQNEEIASYLEGVMKSGDWSGVTITYVTGQGNANTWKTAKKQLDARRGFAPVPVPLEKGNVYRTARSLMEDVVAQRGSRDLHGSVASMLGRTMSHNDIDAVIQHPISFDYAEKTEMIARMLDEQDVSLNKPTPRQREGYKSILGSMDSAFQTGSTNPSDYSKSETVDSTNIDFVFDSLPQSNGKKENRAHKQFLAGMVNRLASKLMTPFTLHMRDVENIPTYGLQSESDVFISRMMKGNYRNSALLAQGVPMSTHEVMAHELNHVVFAEGFEKDSRFRRQFERFFDHAKATLDYTVFMADPLSTNQAEIDGAKATWQYVFENKRGNQLAEFGAYATTNERLINEINKIKAPRKQLFEGDTLYDVVINILNNIVDLFNLQTLGLKEGSNVEQLMGLMEAMNNISTSKVNGITKAGEVVVNTTEQTIDMAGSAISKAIEPLAKGVGKLPLIGGVARLLITDATDDVKDKAIEKYVGKMNEVRDQMLGQKYGLLETVTDEIAGRTHTNFSIYDHVRRSKTLLDMPRKRTKDAVMKNVREAFTEDVTEAEWVAMNKILLKLDVESILDAIGTERTMKILGDNRALDAEINRLETVMKQSSKFNWMVRHAKNLGYFMNTGKSREELTLLNAHNIVSSNYINMSEADQATYAPLVNQLATLYGIKEADTEHRAQVASLGRRDPQGVQNVIVTHEAMKKGAEQQFDTEQERDALFIKGWTKEITDGKSDIKVATIDAEQAMEAQGYSRVPQPIPADPSDPSATEVRYIYVNRTGALDGYSAQGVSLTNNVAKGSNTHDINLQIGMDMIAGDVDVGIITKKKQGAIKQMNLSPNTPTSTNLNPMIPVMNPKGQIVQWRYMMSEKLKDDYLGKDNDAAHVLGSMGANIVDKVNTRVVNREAVEVMHALWMKEKNTRGDAYVAIHAESSDPALRERWLQMPDGMKADANEIFGDDVVYIRKDNIELMFGGRNYSLANLFESDPATRDVWDKIMVMVLQAATLNKNTINRIRKAEDFIQSLTAEVKSRIVVQSVVVPLFNILSNTLHLVINGVNPFTAISSQLRGLIDSNRLNGDLRKKAQLEVELAKANKSAAQRSKLQGELAQVNKRINTNSMIRSYNAGLMPSIVDDVASDLEGDTSMRGRAHRAVSKRVDKMISPKTNGGKIGNELIKSLIGTQDSVYVKAMNNLVMNTDFVARHTLAQHLMKQTQKKTGKKLTRAQEDAIYGEAEDAFVSFGAPTHKGIEYANRMGFAWFTKYMLRNTGAVAKAFKRNPRQFALRMAALDLAGFDSFNDTPVGAALPFRNPLDTLDNPFGAAVDGLGMWAPLQMLD